MREGARGGRGDHEDRGEPTAAAVNGGGGAPSLGLRTGSYGSLQQQQLVIQQQGSVVVSVQCAAPGGGRKQAKTILPGSREKEKFLPWVCKVAGRKRVGMLLLAIVSLVVFVSILSIFGKDEGMSEGPEMNWRPVRPFVGIQKPILSIPPLMPLKDGHDLNATLVADISSASSRELQLQGHFPVNNASVFSSSQYCERFSYSTPPADKKRTGPRPCEVCYAPMEHAVALMPTTPSVSPVLKDLTYFSEGNSHINESNGGSIFGGHPSLQQRDDSFNINESMSVHCGFFKGNGPGKGSGFDIDETDLIEMEQCHGVVVASAIFGNYDILQQPKNISEDAKKSACFFMFLDEETEAYMKNYTTFDGTNRVGIWKVVIVRNLPYADARRNGKVPKLLLHRLFPNARYSLWIDGKLELVVDPYQILERFLWRENATFVISRHYRRFDVFVEAEANKAAGKYDNASIDRQVEFYKKEGLTHYSKAKLPITSDVPEGCVIIREHIPITNLFTCLWFNEVDRFTSRDQISFSTVRDKVMSKVNWTVSMFLDCERRNFVVQAYHRELLEQRTQSIQPPVPPLMVMPTSISHRKPLPEMIPDGYAKSPPKKSPLRHGRDRRSGSRHRRPATGNGKDNSI